LKIEFVTNYYAFAHGRQPRGCGSWAFGSKACTPLDEIFWAPAGSSFTEAKTAAIKWARSAGLSTVYVQS
jgi:hypothetical protein